MSSSLMDMLRNPAMTKEEEQRLDNHINALYEAFGHGRITGDPAESKEPLDMSSSLQDPPTPQQHPNDPEHDISLGTESSGKLKDLQKQSENPPTKEKKLQSEEDFDMLEEVKIVIPVEEETKKNTDEEYFEKI